MPSRSIPERLGTTSAFSSIGITCLVAACIASNVSSDSAAAQENPKKSEVSVKFVVFTPNVDSETDSIYCSMSVDDWPVGGRPIKQLAPGLYTQTMKFQAPSNLKYKFLREQNWKTVEATPSGEDVRNRRLSVESSSKTLTIVHVVRSWADVPSRDDYRIVFPTSEDTSAVTHTGQIRVHRQIHSATLGNRRDVLVWLPPGYDSDTKRRYPVLYMLDGQNIFDESTSFKGDEWQADETATRLVKQREIEPLIVPRGRDPMSDELRLRAPGANGSTVQATPQVVEE